MQYEIMFYVGLASAVITLIITIIAFFKCNVIENTQDLLGGKLKISTNKTNNKSKNINKNEKSNKAKPKTNKIESIKSTSNEIDDTRQKQNSNTESEALSIDNNKDEISNTNVLGNKVNKMYYDPEYTNDQDTLNKYEVNNNSYVDPNSTAILDEDDDATGLLDDDATGLLDDNDATGLLDEDDDATGLLDEDDVDDGFAEKFVKEIDITIVNIDMEI